MRYVLLAQMCINHSSSLITTKELRTEGRTWNDLGTLHHEFLFHCSSEPDKVELTVGAADYFIRSATKGTRFPAHSIYSVSKSTFAELCQMY